MADRISPYAAQQVAAEADRVRAERKSYIEQQRAAQEAAVAAQANEHQEWWSPANIIDKFWMDDFQKGPFSSDPNARFGPDFLSVPLGPGVTGVQKIWQEGIGDKVNAATTGITKGYETWNQLLVYGSTNFPGGAAPLSWEDAGKPAIGEAATTNLLQWITRDDLLNKALGYLASRLTYGATDTIGLAIAATDPTNPALRSDFNLADENQRDRAFRNGGLAQGVAGANGAVTTWFLDPLVIGGKGVKVLRFGSELMGWRGFTNMSVANPVARRSVAEWTSEALAHVENSGADAAKLSDTSKLSRGAKKMLVMAQNIKRMDEVELQNYTPFMDKSTPFAHEMRSVAANVDNERDALVLVGAAIGEPAFIRMLHAEQHAAADALTRARARSTVENIWLGNMPGFLQPAVHARVLENNIDGARLIDDLARRDRMLGEALGHFDGTVKMGSIGGRTAKGEAISGAWAAGKANRDLRYYERKGELPIGPRPGGMNAVTWDGRTIAADTWDVEKLRREGRVSTAEAERIKQSQALGSVTGPAGYERIFQMSSDFRRVRLWSWLNGQHASGYMTIRGIGLSDSTKELTAALGDSKIIKKDVAFVKAMHDIWSKALASQSPEARMIAVRQIEQAVAVRLGAHYGVDEKAMKSIYEYLHLRREQTLNSFTKDGKGRRYGIDPEDNSVLLLDPVFQSQLDTKVPMLDFRQLERSAKIAARGEYADVFKMGENGREVLVNMMDEIASLWKASVLLRLGYTQRNVLEGWLRSWAVLGTMPGLAAAGRAATLPVKRLSGRRAARGFAKRENEVLSSMDLNRQARAIVRAELDNLHAERYNHWHQQATVEVDRRNTIPLAKEQAARAAQVAVQRARVDAGVPDMFAARAEADKAFREARKESDFAEDWGFSPDGQFMYVYTGNGGGYRSGKNELSGWATQNPGMAADYAGSQGGDFSGLWRIKLTVAEAKRYYLPGHIGDYDTVGGAAKWADDEFRQHIADQQSAREWLLPPHILKRAEQVATSSSEAHDFWLAGNWSMRPAVGKATLGEAEAKIAEADRIARERVNPAIPDLIEKTRAQTDAEEIARLTAEEAVKIGKRERKRQIGYIRDEYLSNDAEYQLKVARLRSQIDELDQRHQSLSTRLGNLSAARQRYGKRSVNDTGAFAGELGAMYRDLAGNQQTVDTVLKSHWGRQADARLDDGNWIPVQPKDKQYPAELANAVKQMRNDEAAVMVMNGASPAEVAAWIRSEAGRDYRMEMRLRDQEIEGRAVLVHDMIHNYLPTEAARKLAARHIGKEDGFVPDGESLIAAIGDRSLLQPVHGRQVRDMLNVKIPFTGKTKSFDPSVATFSDIYHWPINKLFHLIGTLPETTLVRQPFYNTVWQRQVKMLESVALEQGRVIDDAFRAKIEQNAHAVALKATNDTLYTVIRYSNPAHLLRFVVPFFPAWENSIRVWLGIIARDPSVAARANTLWQIPNKMGWVVDKDGNKVEGDSLGFLTGSEDQYVVMPQFFAEPLKKLADSPIGSIPGVGAVLEGATLTGLKSAKGSFNVVSPGQTPWLPGFGPMVTAPVGMVLADKPDGQKFLREFLGERLYQQIAPFGEVSGNPLDSFGAPAAKKFWQFRQGEDNQEYLNVLDAMMQQAMVDWYKSGGRPGDKPTLKEVRDMADSFYKFSMLSSLTLPMSVTRMSKYQPLVDKWNQLKAQPGMTYPQKVEAFVTKFGEDYLPLTTSTSRSAAKNLDPTSETYDVLSENKGLVESLAQLGPEAVGIVGATAPPGQFDVGVYNWFLNTDMPGMPGEAYKSKMSGGEMQAQIESSAMWRTYNAAKALIEDEVKRRGAGSIRTKGNADLAAMMRYMTDVAMVNKYGSAWSVAFNDFSQNQGKYLQGIVTVLNDPSFTRAQSPLWQQIRQYMSLRQQAQDAINAGADATVVNAQWDAVRDQMQYSTLEFSDFFDNYLANDKLTIGVTRVAN